MNKILVVVFAVLSLSCAKPDSANMNLAGVFDYKWALSINDVQNAFTKNKYDDINLKEDLITAKMTFNKLDAGISIVF